MGRSLKNLSFRGERGEEFTKNRYRGEGDCLKKGGLGQFVDLRGCGKKEGVCVFEGMGGREGFILRCTLCQSQP